jgi:hypothetical protein
MPLDGYKLLVTFTNDERKIFDVSPLLDRPLYEKLRNKALFNSVKFDAMCVYWDDDTDIAPELLYRAGVSA